MKSEHLIVLIITCAIEQKWNVYGQNEHLIVVIYTCVIEKKWNGYGQYSREKLLAI